MTENELFRFKNAVGRIADNVTTLQALVGEATAGGEPVAVVGEDIVSEAPVIDDETSDPIFNPEEPAEGPEAEDANEGLRELITREIPKGLFGVNTNLAVFDRNFTRPDKLELIAGAFSMLDLGLVCYVGGTTSEHFINKNQMLIQTSEEDYPNGKEDINQGVRYRLGDKGMTAANLVKLAKKAGIPLDNTSVVINPYGVTTVEEEIEGLELIEAAGVPINNVRLGNEAYYDTAFHRGTESHPHIGFKTGYEYGLKMVEWLPKLQARWPKAKFYLIGAVDHEFPKSWQGRARDWNYDVMRSGVTKLTKCWDIHPYVKLKLLKPRFTATEPRDVALADRLAVQIWGGMEHNLDSPSFAEFEPGTEITVSETNTLQGGGFSPLISGGTWGDTLNRIMMRFQLLMDRRITYVSEHVAIGMAHWGWIVDHNGTGVVEEKRGNNRPFEKGMYPPYSITMWGYFLSLTNQIINGGGKLEFLLNEPGRVAIRCTGDGDDYVVYVNGRRDDVEFELPGEVWNCDIYEGDPWASNRSYLDGNIFSSTVQGTGLVQLPAFSLLIAKG